VVSIDRTFVVSLSNHERKIRTNQEIISNPILDHQKKVHPFTLSRRLCYKENHY
jgi:hypothetical protein